MGLLFLDRSTSGPGPIVEDFCSSTSLFGRTSDVVETADSVGEDSYAYSRCSGCSLPTSHTEIVAPSSDRSQPSQPLINERKYFLFWYFTFDLFFNFPFSFRVVPIYNFLPEPLLSVLPLVQALVLPLSVGIVPPEKRELRSHLVTGESFEVHRHHELCDAIDASMELVRGEIVWFLLFFFLYFF